MPDKSGIPVTEAQDLLGFAVGAVESAGRIALRHFRRHVSVTDKSDDGQFDPVTTADLEIERYLRLRLESQFPDDGLLGEEESPKPTGNGRTWVIDPIDGTRAFMTGVPAWGILLGLVVGDIPTIGVMHQPYLGETFAASESIGWFRSGTEKVRLSSSPVRKLAEAVLYSTDPAMFRTASDRRAFAKISESCRMTRFGGDCYSYGLLALGHIDLVIDSALKDVDILPLIPIVEAAGAVVMDAHGASPRRGGLVVAAATRELGLHAIEVLGRSSAAG
jgi:myo-inositol-1(or 4)-monophosphatase